MNKLQSFTVTAFNYYVNQSGDVTDSFYTPGGLGSLASARLQMLPSLIAAQQLGATPRLISLHSSEPQLLDTLQPADACIIGKLSANTDELAHSMIMANLAATTRLKNNGATIVLQYCDNHLNRPKTHPLYKLYKDLFLMADHIIYPSKMLQTLAKSSLKFNAQEHIIYDPWQISKQYSCRELEHEDTCRVIWFGSAMNAKYLTDQLKTIVSQQSLERGFELTILTHPDSINYLKKIIPSLHINAPNWVIRFIRWSNEKQPQQLEHELKRAHVAIIPSDPNDPQKMGVSHNRVVDSARAGCLVLASPMDSYIEIEKICMIDEDIGKMLKEASTNYKKLSTEKNLACNTTLQQFSPSKNLKSWKQAWGNILPHKLT